LLLNGTPFATPAARSPHSSLRSLPSRRRAMLRPGRLGDPPAPPPAASVSRSHDETRGGSQQQASTSGSAGARLVAGAFAGTLSRTATSPLQVVRLRMVSGALDGGGGIPSKIVAIARAEGWRALWKGNLALVMRFAPTKALDFWSFQLYKGWIAARLPGGAAEQISERRGDPTRVGFRRVAVGALAGAAAGLTSTALLFPLDNLTTRLAVDPSSAAAAAGAASKSGGGATIHGVRVGGGVGGVFRGLRAVARSPEGVAGLYRGVKPALVGIAPEAAISYGLYDILRERLPKTPGFTMVAAVVSVALGQTVAFPAEVVSRRMTANPGAGLGAAATLVKIVREHGGLGVLFRGIGPATIRVAPMAAISFGSFEFVREKIDECAGAVIKAS
jgi:solute carrier family 25 phosphate transporter 23/24/25/41